MLRKIWNPIKIRNLELPNRIIMGSMHLGIEGSDNGLKKMIAFYRERAVGNVGLIITGGIAVNKEGAGGGNFLYLDEDKTIEEFAQLTDAIHQVGGRIAAQLFHAGRYAVKRGTGLDPVAPSPLQAPINETPPRELSHDEIVQTIDDFVQSARRAKMAGFDAIEIMGSEGYLINQFLSPVTNMRTDEWGGNFKRRARFGIEIVEKIRQQVGEDYPILFRMSGLDLVSNSTTMEETVQFAKWLEKAGVDVLNVGIGWHESKIPTIAMFVPRGSYTWVAGKIREYVNIPVVASNRINRPELAEEILLKGQADLVSMARPFLADPYLLMKAKEDRLPEIKTCVACNQACLDHVFSGKAVSCVVNPSAGREWLEEWKIKVVNNKEDKKKIAVIGAGPAGLEASRVLAERGHQVTLFERNPHIGGQLHYARVIPGKEEWGETIDYYQHQLEKLGVEIKLNKEVAAKNLIQEKYDHIMVATGSKMKIPDIKGINSSNVTTYLDILENKTIVGKDVVIIGAGGIAVDISHLLLEKTFTPEIVRYLLEYQVLDNKDAFKLIQSNRTITIMRRKGKIGAGLGRTTRWAVLSRLKYNGVNMLTGVEYKEITEEGILIRYQDEDRFLAADTVILATGQVENNVLYKELKQYVSVSVIGGAKAVGELDAKKAIYEGAQIGRLI
ncbi:NADPH-dependent 2,4-dienoyl-CoA reductase [Vulcanibacillus modesticaldus]|uniref:NADPH-dependent 2,4-dienoyl-CoA reductase n=1 Tax=Vulcanibacillus modesticaldus TaxID=337097 RepID=A0A1D2YUS7_9BACI|nr:FAD-dependent oxidoreductase [Vulcanibacillus modesticaldus]OEF99437.1 NADPH-dependent 2,4-dienoyl-CoA reductase [Vulcanibacillus modesticaldus]